MSWIKQITYQEAKGRLKKLYDRVKGPNDNVDNIMLAHSLRPHTMEGHMRLYKNVLHHRDNKLPKWYLETVGLYVSILNKCSYCVDHHFEGLRRLLKDDAKADDIKKVLSINLKEGVFSGKEMEGLKYVQILTEHPQKLQQKDAQELKNAGFTDGEILELNQVAAYFAYANRTVLGLGVSATGDVLGLSPKESDNPDDWSHK